MVVGNGTPVYRHQTLMSAMQEAERLANLHPGSEFTVLKSVKTCVKRQVQWISHVEIDPHGNEVPF